VHGTAPTEAFDQPLSERG
jgi:hypothetical protein